MNRNLQIITVLLLLGIQASTTSAREWKDSTGTFSVEAEFVALIDADKVRLKKPNGVLITVPLNRLSDADRTFVAELTKPKPAADKFAEDLNPARSCALPPMANWRSKTRIRW